MGRMPIGSALTGLRRETCPLPYRSLPPHVMAASPNRADTRNTYG
jgi:hypothetical protein